MKEEHKNRVDEEYICWSAIPIEYDSFRRKRKIHMTVKSLGVWQCLSRHITYGEDFIKTI